MEPEVIALLVEHGYECQSVIGHGGTSHVFLCNSLRYAGEQFAIKQVERGKADEVRTKEIRHLCSLSSPYIINLYEFFEDDQYFYLALEYCPGGSIMNLIENCGPLQGPELLTFCYDITKGVYACHNEQIAHADIKPANILIDRHGRAKLADFGLSHSVHLGEVSRQFLGSRLFLAPEVCDRVAFDPFLADVWSLGVTFYWMAVGQSPFLTADASQLEEAIHIGLAGRPDWMPFEFYRLIRAMVEPDPSARISIAMVYNHAVFAEFKKMRRATSLSPTPGRPEFRAIRGRHAPVARWNSVILPTNGPTSGPLPAIRQTKVLGIRPGRFPTFVEPAGSDSALLA